MYPISECQAFINCLLVTFSSALDISGLVSAICLIVYFQADKNLSKGSLVIATIG